MELFGTEYGFCSQTASLWQFVGYLILIIKIIVPLALIIIGIITLGKSVISSDEGENKKRYSSLVKRLITAVCIFFIPAIITAFFSVVSGFKEVRPDFNVCQRCMNHPHSAYCNNKVLALNYFDD